ncbi:MAG TPA: benzoate-CoA ligase family protein [Egibacteraceae bacterium]|nr:benzoate-CoA ligase family protein [Egibacteraceae bacterium]
MATAPRFDPPEQINIADWFLGDRLAEGGGDRVALRTDDGTLTYAEVDRLANRTGSALRAMGVRQEERVLVALPDSPAYVAALFGALKIGAVVVMVNPDLPVDNLAGIVGYSRAPVVLTSPSAAEVFEAAASSAGRPLQVVAVEGDALEGDESLDTVATHRDDPAIWLFSGGTTGRPKAVVQTHRSFANTTELYAKGAMGYGPDDITISVPKLYFGYATGSNLFFPFSVGGSAVLFPERPTPDGLFKRIARHRATILINVPKLIKEMVDYPGAGRADLSSLRFATSAGEALPPALYQRWKDAFGVELLDGLGTAEMWHVFLTNTLGDVRPGSLGKPVPGFDVRVRDADGNDLGDDEVGRLWVRGDSRAICYWQDMPKSAEAFRGEWFAAGDLVRRDADGYIHYVGRGDDAMKVGGKWLLPAEVESCLLDHPRVSEAAVVGVPDRDGLTKPVAFVVAHAEPEDDLEARLIEHVLERLEPYKRPRAVVVADALPRTHLGKVNRAALRDQGREALT